MWAKYNEKPLKFARRGKTSRSQPKARRGGVFLENHGKNFCLCSKICVNTLSFPPASRVALRSGAQFADTLAFAERCSGARYYCCHCAPQENRTQSHRRTLGFPPLTRSICFRSHSQKRFAVQRFFAIRRNERFQRAVRLCRTAAYCAPFRRRQFAEKSVNVL